MKKGKKNQQKKHILIASIVLVILIVILVFVIKSKDKPMEETEENQPISQEISVEEGKEYTLEDGLLVSDIASYAGIYMEDGTDEVVEDVMMIILTNTNEKDLQFARVDITYGEFVAEFETSNLPAGESVVLLERNRHEMIEEKPDVIEARNVVFFEESMSLEEDTFEIKGLEQGIEVKNISDKDIEGDIFVYYKNSASDLLYGGITYRVRISGGLKAGDSASVPTTHYSPDNSRLLMVTAGESKGE